LARIQVLGRRDPEIVEAGITLGDMAVLDQAGQRLENPWRNREDFEGLRFPDQGLLVLFLRKRG
jgi:hypothetical protein